MASERPTFTREQLAKYIGLIYNCPAGQELTKLLELEEIIQQDPLGALTAIQQRQLSAIPFSNVGVHYSQHHTISLDPDQVFHKLVERKLGGYCMEATNLLAIAIRSLGYQVYTTGGRVSNSFSGPNPTRDFGGWAHMLLLVTIEGKKFMLDVGFGPNGPTRPVPLEDDKPTTSIAPAQMRLTNDNISPNIDRSQRLWIFQTRPNSQSEWQDVYCFYEIEFLPPDYEIMNFATSQRRTSMFTNKLVCARYLLNEAEDDIMGMLSLIGADLKRNINGNIEKFATLKSEAERISALEKWFNIHLHQMEVRGIRGTAVEIRESVT
ncbi:hypothetical protein AJ79_05991 [Helicocarpus griseus UAMH5409]|uniref:Uncharacterized protein n=1 Tax=Helicocarpus griseus UAMH5409 TaxID=1447875 RepID=A0A2B7XI99_9EURO|nr:hypothetical protein AJ79_05991 [Helicocarpus griseus UAMH5409]